jgi:hypothetical protein
MYPGLDLKQCSAQAGEEFVALEKKRMGCFLVSAMQRMTFSQISF